MDGRHVFVAVSGGVDSSVAAALLQKQGYRCSGIFMITHDQAHTAQSDAQRACDHLGIELHVLDLRRDFQAVIDYFCDTYSRGETPNPCVYCNRAIKFGVLWNYAREHGADFIATGHYAAIRTYQGRPALCAAKDDARDQSYVLSMIRREVLGHILFPMAEMEKPRTRQIAAETGLHTQHRKDSQEICFIPDNDYIGRLRQWRPDIGGRGKIVDTDGRVLGEHDGIHQFTIGQRRGLGIALGRPAYVVKIDAGTNTVTLGSKEDLLSGTLELADINWLIDPPTTPFHSKVKIRYNHKGSPATVVPDTERPGRARIEFDRPVSAITPGQAAVMYLADGSNWLVAGGGWIRQTTENAE
jgi:tRNA-specific 2-thiouridylase